MACKLWKMLAVDADGVPEKEPAEGIDFVNVIVDGHTCHPVRHDGGGPSGRSLRADEGYEEIRRLYIPDDGLPHQVALEFRTNGHRSYHKRISVPAPMRAASRAIDECASPIVSEYTAHQAEADAIRVAFGHAAESGRSVVHMAERHASESARLHRGMLADSASVFSKVIEATARANASAVDAANARATAAEVNAARAYEHAQAGLQATLTAAQAANAQAMQAVAERGGGGGGVIEALAPYAPMAMAAGGVLVDKLGGFDGIIDKLKGLLGGAAGAANAKGEVLYAAVDRLGSAFETGMAMRNVSIDGGGYDVDDEPDADPDDEIGQ